MRLSARELRRLMSRYGMLLKELEGVEHVEIKLMDRRLIFENPKVMILSIGGKGEIYQVVGELREVPVEAMEEELEIPEEDAQLIAVQAGVSLDEARKALIEFKGDLARAIMELTSRKKLTDQP